MERVEMVVFEQDKKEMGTEEGPFGPGGGEGWIRGCFFCARVAQADPRCHLCFLCPLCMAQPKPRSFLARAIVAEPRFESPYMSRRTHDDDGQMGYAVDITGPLSVHRSRYAQHVSLPPARHL